MSIFQDANNVNSAGKFLVFGSTGEGKSHFALTFPKVFGYDSEQGLNFYLDNPNLLKVATTASIYDMQDGIDELHEMLDKDPNSVKTVIFDSETKFYQNIQDISLRVEEKRAKEKGRDVDDANLSMRSWGRIKSVSNRLQNMKIDLSSRGINIVSTAHEADIKKKVGDEYVVVGHKPDIYKNLPFDYDVILRMYTEEDKKTGELRYYAEVRKDRTGTFDKNTVVENPSYDMWENKLTDNVESKSTDYASDTGGDTKKMMDEENEKEKVDAIVDALKKAIGKTEQDKKIKVAQLLKDNNTNIEGLSEFGLSELRDLKDSIVDILKDEDKE